MRNPAAAAAFSKVVGWLERRYAYHSLPRSSWAAAIAAAAAYKLLQLNSH